MGLAGREARPEGHAVTMTGRLQDKIALVTGAGCIGPGWGNGRATAVLFAREGAKVFAVDKNGDVDEGDRRSRRRIRRHDQDA